MMGRGVAGRWASHGSHFASREGWPTCVWAYGRSVCGGDFGRCLHRRFVGVGPGACSHHNGIRVTNIKPLEQWASAALAGLPPTASAETLRPLQRAAEALWLGIRRTSGVDLDSIQKRLQLDIRGVVHFEPYLGASGVELGVRVPRIDDPHAATVRDDDGRYTFQVGGNRSPCPPRPPCQAKFARVRRSITTAAT